MGTRLAADVVSVQAGVPQHRPCSHHPCSHIVAHNARLAAQNGAVAQQVAQSQAQVTQVTARLAHNMAQLDALLAASKEILDSVRNGDFININPGENRRED